MLGKIKFLTIVAKPALWSIAVFVLLGGIVLFTIVCAFRHVQPLFLNKFSEWLEPNTSKFKSAKAHQFRKVVLGY